jgi:cytochrome oxidase Cu insertion factor (SCO1/SenC/PrrC family)
VLIAARAVIVAVTSLAFFVIRRNAARETAPDFILTDTNGLPFRLSQQRGRALVLDFGYTHCSDVCPSSFLPARCASQQACIIASTQKQR